jgi:hypothetical protein
MMRSSALISHVQQLARDFHAQASRYPTKKQDAQKPVDHSACIVRRCSSAIRLFVADVCKGFPPFPSLPRRALSAFDSFWTSHRSTWSSTANMFDPRQMERLTDVFERIRSNVLCA